MKCWFWTSDVDLTFDFLPLTSNLISGAIEVKIASLQYGYIIWIFWHWKWLMAGYKYGLIPPQLPTVLPNPTYNEFGPDDNINDLLRWRHNKSLFQNSLWLFNLFSFWGQGRIQGGGGQGGQRPPPLIPFCPPPPNFCPPGQLPGGWQRIFRSLPNFSKETYCFVIKCYHKT